VSLWSGVASTNDKLSYGFECLRFLCSVLFSPPPPKIKFTSCETTEAHFAANNSVLDMLEDMKADSCYSWLTFHATAVLLIVLSTLASAEDWQWTVSSRMTDSAKGTHLPQNVSKLGNAHITWGQGLGTTSRWTPKPNFYLSIWGWQELGLSVRRSAFVAKLTFHAGCLCQQWPLQTHAVTLPEVVSCTAIVLSGNPHLRLGSCVSINPDIIYMYISLINPVYICTDYGVQELQL